MIKIDQAFNPETKSVYSFFQNPGIGYYIPLYQRPYSWDSDNVDQLLDDISKGVENMLSNEKDEIRFLGTIITVIETNKSSIEPQDPTGLPGTIENVIDGQQRLSTITMLAAELYFALHSIETRLLKKKTINDSVEEIGIKWKNKLINVFSMDLDRGTPRRKPKIIRGNKDAWTKDGDIKQYYKSSVSKYLAQSILNIHSETYTVPKLNKKIDDKVFSNTKLCRSWINKIVSKAHINSSDDYPQAKSILKKFSQDQLWDYDRPELEQIVCDDSHELFDLVSSLTQVVAACHYLLDRCCFTSIQPKNDDWAFDMFQSLNATGTPLTAIETFHPIVVHSVNEHEDSYKKSTCSENFKQIDALFKDTTTAAQKSKLSNDFLTSFRIVIDGNKLESHFSKQRKWLSDTFLNPDLNYSEKVSFISFFGSYASFYKEVWIDYDGSLGAIQKIQGANDSELASLLILFLRDSSHKMAITIIGTLYHNVVLGKENSISEFIETTKAIAAFYILWRYTRSNAGLDNVYREYFKGKEEVIDPHNWLSSNEITSSGVKKYLKFILTQFDILDKTNWLRKAKRTLGYDTSKSVSRISLFISSHDTISDGTTGLMRKGASNSNPFLKIEKWLSKDLKSIEHIAPESPSPTWSNDLYDDDEAYHLVGNCTLLPVDLNSSVGNKGFVEKQIYYKHVSEKDITERKELSNAASKLGLRLSHDTVSLLENCSYNSHLEPLTKLDSSFPWNKDFVIKRSERIAEIVYDSVVEWLK